MGVECPKAHPKQGRKEEMCRFLPCGLANAHYVGHDFLFDAQSSLYGGGDVHFLIGEKERAGA